MYFFLDRVQIVLLGHLEIVKDVTNVISFYFWDWEIEYYNNAFAFTAKINDFFYEHA